MKVIFLDIDGVLNPYNYESKMARPGTHPTFSKAACVHLNTLLTAVPEAKIVISSSWRRWGLEYMKEALKQNGIPEERAIDVTGNENGNRGLQIQKWLERNSNPTHFVIIDDESDMGDLMTNLVKTNSFVGLTEKDTAQAIEILSK